MSWQTISVTDAFRNTPPALDFVIPGLVAGTVGSIVAPGAVGKSWLALQLAAAVAGGDTIDLLHASTGRVLYLAGEDPAEVLHQRIHALGSVLSAAQREAVAERLAVVPLLGRVGDLLDDGQTAGQVVGSAEGCRLVVVDTLSRFHTGDENARSDAARVMRRLEAVADRTGAAVLFLHHTNKSATLEGQGAMQQASRGSSVFVDDARFVMTMTGCTDAEARDFGIDEAMRGFFVKLNYAKCNYVAPQPARWFRKQQGGRLEPVEMFKVPQKRSATANKGGDDDDWR